MTIDVIEVQSAKALLPIVVTPLPIVTEFKPVQPPNVAFSIAGTLSGIVTVVKAMHSLNALAPILATPLQIVRFDRE
jgi:hypothetical protein